MHYLEDDLELLEGIPEELKQQCFEMRELDGRVEKSLAEVREESREFFNVINQLSMEERDKRYAKIRESYKTIREISEEKLAIAEYLHLMLEKYQERVAKDLTEFKFELEADTAGVTESIERELSESISKSANANRRNRPVLGNLADVVDADDSGFEDIKPSIGPSSTPNSASGGGMFRMNGHRHSGSSEPQVSAEERAGGEEFFKHQQRRLVSSSSRTSLDRTLAAGSLNPAQEVYLQPPKKKIARLSSTSHMSFGQGQQQTLDAFGIQKQSASQFSTTQMPVVPPVGGGSSSSANATRPPPPRFNYSAVRHPSVGQAPGQHVRSNYPDTDHPSGMPNTPIHERALGSTPSNTYQQQLQGNTGPPTTPIVHSFAGISSGQTESQSSYGRPVKLTSRVQQMLKDRQQSTHRIGRPPGSALYSTSHGTQAPSSTYGFGPGQFPHNPHQRMFNNQQQPMGELSEEEGRQQYYGQHGHNYLDGEEEADEEDMLGEEEEADEDSEDQDNRVWCTCQQKSEGDMVACDNKMCPYEWFHYSCVGITAPPKGKWFCPTCVIKMRRSQSMESR